MKITIAIPSHNKTELLDSALRSIVNEIKDIKNVSVLVSDNSESDETKLLVQNKYSAFDRIIYRRSNDAPSLDENVHKAVMESEGDYVWIFGDDDILLPLSISKILQFIEENNPGIVIVNSNSFNNEIIIEDRRVDFLEDRLYGLQDNNNFLEDFGGYVTYVPSIIIKRSLWSISHSGDALGTYFSHIDTLFRAKRKCVAGFISQPCIGMRVSSQTWTALHYRIWNTFYPQVIWGLDGYSNDSKGKVTPRFLKNSFRPILSSRAYGRLNFHVLTTEIFEDNSVHFSTKIFATLVCLIPIGFLKSLYLIYIDKFSNKKTKKFSPALAKSQL